MSLSYKVPGIGCEGCARHIEEALAGVPGLSGLSVDVAARVVTLELAPPATPEAVEEALRQAGYPPSS